MSRLQAAFDLAFTAFDGAVSRVEEVHAAVARRPFAAVTRTGLPVSAVRDVHDGVTALVYASIRATGAAADALAGTVLGVVRAARRERYPEPASPWAEHALGALGGMVGDRLEREGSALGVRMELRHRDRGLVARSRGGRHGPAHALGQG
jgi:hypothetical protein